MKKILLLSCALALMASCSSVTANSLSETDRDVGATKMVKAEQASYDLNFEVNLQVTAPEAGLAGVEVEIPIPAMIDALARNANKDNRNPVPFVKERIHIWNCSVRQC